MNKRWVLKQVDEALVSVLTKKLQVSPLIARLLANRGLTEPGAAEKFLSSSLRSDLPSPSLMAGMDEAVARLVAALDGKEQICVWGDYDVDGTTGAATLVSFLKEAGARASYYVPHRINEGYGLNVAGMKELAGGGVSLVVTVDCGISNATEVAAARELGIDTIVVDHHELPAKLPPAVAIINPHRSDCRFPDKGLSGAGLAFYLVMALRAKLRDSGWFGGGGAKSPEGEKPRGGLAPVRGASPLYGVPDVRRCLDIVTLGTIADMVPLRGVNRVLVRRGLVELGGSTRPGILALKRVAGIAPGEVGVGQVAFRLGPRINAAGRMDAGLKVVEMLTTDSEEVALRIAQELDADNRERREMEARVLAEALSTCNGDGFLQDRYSVVVGQEGWHPGVLGIVASRLTERFYRPTVVVGFRAGEGKGSARSIRGFHLVEGFGRCADLLEKYGGHEYAAGLTIREEKFPLFRDRFEEIARAGLRSEDLIPALEIDSELEFSAMGFPLMRELDGLRPFGVGNPEPLFLTRSVEVTRRRDFNGGTRVKLRQGSRSFDAVMFDDHRGSTGDPGREPAPRLVPGAKIDLVYRLSENEWNGTRSVELRLVDARNST